jgi:hypothetical protein
MAYIHNHKLPPIIIRLYINPEWIKQPSVNDSGAEKVEGEEKKRVHFYDLTCQNESIPKSNISYIRTAEAFWCKAFVLKGSSFLQTLK